ncbi:MAG: malic enzyme-like NAD(P)-binding protein [Pseudomonadota bacterium]
MPIITVLIGTSGQPGCFNKEIINAVMLNTDRPAVLPLSNPTSKAEALPKDIYEWTNGKALVATGSPFPDIKLNGKDIRIGQMNNAFIFPGVGLGIVASGATEVLPIFFSAAAHAVAEYISKEELAHGILCPPLNKLREVSVQVAKKVAAEAIKAGVCKKGCAFAEYKHNDDVERMNTLIDKMIWKPVYFNQA